MLFFWIGSVADIDILMRVIFRLVLSRHHMNRNFTVIVIIINRLADSESTPVEG